MVVFDSRQFEGLSFTRVFTLYGTHGSGYPERPSHSFLKVKSLATEVESL